MISMKTSPTTIFTFLRFWPPKNPGYLPFLDLSHNVGFWGLWAHEEIHVAHSIALEVGGWGGWDGPDPDGTLAMEI